MTDEHTRNPGTEPLKIRRYVLRNHGLRDLPPEIPLVTGTRGMDFDVDHDRLSSLENYQIRKRAMELADAKGIRWTPNAASAPIGFNARDLPPLAVLVSVQ